MSHAHHDPTVPRGALIAVAALLALTLTLTAVVSAGFLPKEGDPQGGRAAAAVTAVEVRQLRFADRTDGAVTVNDAATGVLVTTIPYGQGGFTRATLRRLAKARKAANIGAEPPFELVRWANGALSLRDPETGKSAEIHGFGPDHSRAFANMLKGTGA
jgi:putative photosynthetic complex assembly protein